MTTAPTLLLGDCLDLMATLPEQSVDMAQKPVALCEYLIRTYTQPGDVVLDPTMGSGSTLVAAINTGRRNGAPPRRSTMPPHPNRDGGSNPSTDRHPETAPWSNFHDREKAKVELWPVENPNRRF